MTYRSLRTALLGSAVGAGMLVAGGPANALSTQIGDVNIFFDTTVSVGVSMRTVDARQQFLTEFNGGNRDLREADPNAVAIPSGPNAFGVAGTITNTAAVGANFDDSPNTDDRFLNFGAGDLISGNVKATHDLQATWRNFTLFARATEFYDAVLNRDSSYNRFGIDDNNREEVGRDAKILDLYLSADFDLADLPVNVRAGKQVISWGEGTFILNGINSVNPIDVNAFRKPGAEIKEGLIPVWALYGSVGLPFDLSLEAFYQLDWEPFQLDPAGTPFAGSDVANANSSFGGNQGLGFYSGSIRNGFNVRDCRAPSAVTGGRPTGQLAAALGTAATYNTLFGNGCSTASPQHFLTNLPTDGSAQGVLVTGFAGEQGDPRLLGTARGADSEASDDGQWGVALRWYAEDLNSTEFGFYYMKYHSRLPIAQVEAAGVPQVTISTASPENLFTSRAASSIGCVGGGTGTSGVGLLVTGDFRDPALQNGGFAETNVIFNDPNDIAGSLGPTAIAALTAAGLGAAPIVADIAADIATPGTVSARTLAGINCGILVGVGNTTVIPGLPVAPDGTEFTGAQQNLQTRLIYPEDIELWGISFNTTIGDWGVQGEFSYRPNQPLQVDTDEQTITGAGSQCVALVTFRDANLFNLSPLSTEPGTQNTSCSAATYNIGTGTGRVPTAFVREEVFTFQIGTTATYTNSNPLIEFLGADIGILVTEFGLVHVPDLPDELPVGAPAGTVPERNVLEELCRSGTALPLGAVLSLDQRQGCAPTETSYGMVLLTRLDYNNAFGTAWTLSPQIVYRHDLEGLTPAPLGNYKEDRRSVSLAVNGTLQNTWKVGVSYTNFMGGEEYQQDLDDDFVSLTASYSF